jgi:hypothetical protein
MLFRPILISLTCVAVASCNANAEIKVPKNIDSLQSSANIKNTAGKIASFAVENNYTLADDSKSEVSKNITSQKLNKGNNKSQIVSTGPGFQSNGNYMTLTPTEKANSLGNPLYELHLFANGQLVGSYMTVSGRAYTQNRNRNTSGTEAPLPDGRYKVATVVTRGSTPEAGDRFLSIQPLFTTGRSSLGIHYDPSFEKNNGEDGTSGCVGLTNREDLSLVLEYVHTYNPQFLDVAIR